MTQIESKLKELKIDLPEPKAPVGAYVATKITGKLLFISGQVSVDKDGNLIKGKIGKDLSLEQAKFLCSLPKILGQNPDTGKDITLNSGRFGPYLKCENKSARLENVEELFTIGINRAITLIAEAKPGRISSSLIKDLGEHPEDKKPVRIMKGQYGPYIKYKSLNATIPEEKDPTELSMEDALILIEKRREYDKTKKKRKKK